LHLSPPPSFDFGNVEMVASFNGFVVSAVNCQLSEFHGSRSSRVRILHNKVLQRRNFTARGPPESEFYGSRSSRIGILRLKVLQVLQSRNFTAQGLPDPPESEFYGSRSSKSSRVIVSRLKVLQSRVSRSKSRGTLGPLANQALAANKWTPLQRLGMGSAASSCSQQDAKRKNASITPDSNLTTSKFHNNQNSHLT
jgi:hypothetical protein